MIHSIAIPAASFWRVIDKQRDSTWRDPGLTEHGLYVVTSWHPVLGFHSFGFATPLGRIVPGVFALEDREEKRLLHSSPHPQSESTRVFYEVGLRSYLSETTQVRLEWEDKQHGVCPTCNIPQGDA